MKKHVCVLVVLLLAGCNQLPTANQIEAQRQEQLSAAANSGVGMPAIKNFAEKKMMKMIMELRDNPKLSTTTYIVDMSGHAHKVCDSVGYGLPYATQFTNPQRVEFAEGVRGIVLPQPDPNGLYAPASAEGTWVLCLDPRSKDITPTYIEPRVIVSTFPLTF